MFYFENSPLIGYKSHRGSSPRFVTKLIMFFKIIEIINSPMLMDKQVIGQIRVNKSATFLYHNTSKSVSFDRRYFTG